MTHLSGKLHVTVYICHPLIPTLLLVFMCSLLTGMRSSLTIPPSETAKAGNVAAVRTKYLKFNGHCLEFYYTNIHMWGNLSVISIAENQQRDTVLVLTDSWNMKRAFVKLQDGTQRLEIRFERAHMRFSLRTSITGISIWPCFEFSKFSIPLISTYPFKDIHCMIITEGIKHRQLCPACIEPLLKRLSSASVQGCINVF